MRLTFELDEECLFELLQQLVTEKEQKDAVKSLFIGFERNEPAMFFYPDWDFDFEVILSLTEALQDYLEEEDHDIDAHRDLVTRLLATINEWKKEKP